MNWDSPRTWIWLRRLAQWYLGHPMSGLKQASWWPVVEREVRRYVRLQCAGAEKRAKVIERVQAYYLLHPQERPPSSRELNMCIELLVWGW